MGEAVTGRNVHASGMGVGWRAWFETDVLITFHDFGGGEASAGTGFAWRRNQFLPGFYAEYGLDVGALAAHDLLFTLQRAGMGMWGGGHGQVEVGWWVAGRA